MRFNAGISPLFPACCVICHRKPEPELDLCPDCLGHLVSRVRDEGGSVYALCPVCGVECLGGNCESCDNKTPLYARIVCPFRYTFPLNRMIQTLKYGHDRVMGRVLGELLAYRLRLDDAGQTGEEPAERPDMVIPVPLHPRRLAKRGFNHAADIARFAAGRMNLPWSEHLAERVEDTGSLAGLSRAEREQRIRGAFSASEEVANKRLVIVDDVMTSGATSSELARELYDTGAASVELWVVARTPVD